MEAPNRSSSSIEHSRWESFLRETASQKTPIEFELIHMDRHIPALFKTIVSSSSALDNLVIIFKKSIDKRFPFEIANKINQLRPGLLPPEVIPVSHRSEFFMSWPDVRFDLTAPEIIYITLFRDIAKVGSLVIHNQNFRNRLKDFLESQDLKTMDSYSRGMFVMACSALDKMAPDFLNERLKTFVTGKKTIVIGKDSLQVRNYKLALLKMDSKQFELPSEALGAKLFKEIVEIFYNFNSTNHQLKNNRINKLSYDAVGAMLVYAKSIGNDTLIDHLSTIRERIEAAALMNLTSCLSWSTEKELAALIEDVQLLLKASKNKDYEFVANLISAAMKESKQNSLAYLKQIKEAFPELVYTSSLRIGDEDEGFETIEESKKSIELVTIDLSSYQEKDLDIDKFSCLFGMNIQFVFARPYLILRQIATLFPVPFVIKQETIFDKLKASAIDTYFSLASKT